MQGPRKALLLDPWNVKDRALSLQAGPVARAPEARSPPNPSYLRVIENHGAGCAEGQESSKPWIPTQSSSNPIRAAKHMRHLEHRRHHDAKWSVAETLPRTSAPERNYSYVARATPADTSRSAFPRGRGGAKAPSSADHASWARPRLLAWFSPAPPYPLLATRISSTAVPHVNQA